LSIAKDVPNAVVAAFDETTDAGLRHSALVEMIDKQVPGVSLVLAFDLDGHNQLCRVFYIEVVGNRKDALVDLLDSFLFRCHLVSVGCG
jgi:hypothetical protein